MLYGLVAALVVIITFFMGFVCGYTIRGRHAEEDFRSMSDEMMGTNLWDGDGRR